MTAVIKH